MKDLEKVSGEGLDDPDGVRGPTGDAEDVGIVLVGGADLQPLAGQGPVDELDLDVVDSGLLHLRPDVVNLSGGEDVAVGDDHDEVSGAGPLPAPPQQTLRRHLGSRYGLLGQLGQDGGHRVPGAELNELQSVALVVADGELRVSLEEAEEGEADRSQAAEVPGAPTTVLV